MTRNKKLYLNIFTAFISQAVILICGFVLPRYILGAFGSDVNGLVTSITRFLSIISFLELGVGPVIQSNLYKPLAEKNENEINKILVSTKKFYRRISYIFLAYIAALFFAYPALNNEFDYWFTATLILIISISSFVQYYFGLTYQVFLNADQKVYIGQISQIVTVILNTVISIVLIKLGCLIHIVKLASALIFVLRPFIFLFYVRKNYKIDWKIKYDDEPIKQKWNGFAQHLAAFVCGEIDVILLTFLASYQDVSIYSTYFLVANGICTIMMTFSSGISSYWGNMIAKNEDNILKKSFDNIEFAIHFGVGFLFSCTAFLIEPFIKVYVKGIPDSIIYSVPIFGITLTIAYALRCLRIPYFAITMNAAGHYKQTQAGAFISMILNIVVSIVLVLAMDNKLLGVAIGTVVAMLFHTVYFAWYLRKNILKRPFTYFFKHIVIDVIIFIEIYFATRWIVLGSVTYAGWIVMALKVSAVALGITCVTTFAFYYKQIKVIISQICRKIKRESH